MLSFSTPSLKTVIIIWNSPDPPESFISLSSLTRYIKSSSGCWRARQQPVQSGEPCQGGFCSDGPWSCRTAAQAPHQSHIPPWPLLLHPCGQGNHFLLCILCNLHMPHPGDTGPQYYLFMLRLNIEQCIWFPAWCWLRRAHKCFYGLGLLALWRLNLSHGSHSVVKGISLDRVKSGYS